MTVFFELVFDFVDAAADLEGKGLFLLVHRSDLDRGFAIESGEGLGQSVGAMGPVAKFF